MKEISTKNLDRILSHTKPDDIGAFLFEHKEDLRRGEWPFGSYMKECFRERGLKQQEVFIAADCSESYGYKLLSGEKHTVQRDLILRLCFGGRLTLEEAQRALKLYGMAPLYAKLPRDAVLMIAFNTGVHDIWEVNSLLARYEMEELFHFNT